MPATCSAARATASWPSSIRTPTSSTTTSPRRRRSDAPIVAVFETHVQADHVSGLPELVERTGATAYLPDGAGVEFEHDALADGDAVELGNTLVTAIATPGHAPGPSRLRGRRPAPRRRRAVARVQRRLAADRRRRPPRPARRRRRATARRGCCTRACADCSSCPTTSCSTRVTTAARSAAAGSPATRSPRSGSSARTTRCSRSPTPTRSPTALVADTPPPPGRAGADRRREPRRHGRRARMSAPVRLGLRANARQFALLVGLNALVGGDGRARAERAAARRQAGLRPALDRGDPRLRPRVRRREGAHQPRRRRARRADRPQAAARDRLAGRAAGAAADRRSRPPGGSSSPPTSCSASTRASPGR